MDGGVFWGFMFSGWVIYNLTKSQKVSFRQFALDLFGVSLIIDSD